MGMFQFRMAMTWQQRTDSPEQVNPLVLCALTLPWISRSSPELAPRSTEGVFDKLTMSAFEGLVARLRVARLRY